MKSFEMSLGEIYKETFDWLALKQKNLIKRIDAKN
jgi:hypothetical protein